MVELLLALTVLAVRLVDAQYVILLATKSMLVFFQAEDGIRDGTVTGVQTCALPISWPAAPRRSNARRGPGSPGPLRGRRAGCWPRGGKRTATTGWGPGADCRDRGSLAGGPRSEERRVGKECRSRGARGAYKEDEERG